MTDLFDTLYSGYDQAVLDVHAVRFNIYLISFSKCVGPDRQIEKSWDRLKFDQIKNRWWYFRRYAAKQQLENPFRVYCFEMQRNLNEQDAAKAYLKSLINKQISAKAKVTQITNRIETAKAAWNSLFPIEEDEGYQKAMGQLFLKKQAVLEFEKEISELTNNPT